MRRWVELDCASEVDALIDWLRKGEAGAFSGAGLPFYLLHAKLYLLIAFARAAVDNAQHLSRHASIFRDIALSGLPHFFIQSTAAQIALLVEGSRADSISTEDVRQLRTVGQSVMEPRILKGLPPRVDSPRHARGPASES